MPAPDPHGLYIEEYENGGFGIIGEIWWHGNRATRMNRMRRIAENISRGWRCAHCGEPIPISAGSASSLSWAENMIKYQAEIKNE